MEEASFDFWKAFDSLERRLILKAEPFGFGWNFIQTVKMIYKDINNGIYPCDDILTLPVTPGRFVDWRKKQEHVFHLLCNKSLLANMRINLQTPVFN